MDIQTRKLKAIEYLIGLQDEKVLEKIESAIVEFQEPQTIKRDIDPLTQEQLIERAKQSTSNYLSGRYRTQEQLEQESDNW